MKIIGVCGSSGSGKSSFASCFSKLGIPVLDCDKIYHGMISAPSPCLSAIEKRFGSKVIRDGALDRKALGKIVYSDRSLLNELNSITHRFVLDELSSRIELFKSKGVSACVVDAPMLFESGLDLWCDFICCVVASRDVQISRICQRDGISEEDAIIRINNQLNVDELSKKSDFIIQNNGDTSVLDDECRRVLKEMNILI